MTNTNISVIDDYHRSLIASQPFAVIYPVGVEPPADDAPGDDEATAKVVRRPKTAKTSATEEGVETK